MDALRSYRQALRTVLPYTVFGCLWIWGSDLLLGQLVHDTARLTAISTYKGWAFMAVTSLLLFFLVLRRIVSNQRLHRKLQAKHAEMEEFLYAASHQMRGPLVTIGGFSGEIEESLKPGQVHAPEELQQSAGQIKRGVQELDGILKGLTRMHRILRLSATPSTLDMKQMLQHLQRQFSKESNAEILWDIGDLPKCLANRNQVEALFRELIDNAVQHRDPTKALHLRIQGASHRALSRYMIEDDGPGFTVPSNRNTQPSVRKQVEREEGKPPMGLLIAERCALWNDGELSVESEPGKGTKITVSLPTIRY